MNTPYFTKNQWDSPQPRDNNPIGEKSAIEKALTDFGSPLFLFSEHTLKEQYMILRQALNTCYPRSTIAYSYKTNYLPYICKLLQKEGAWAEVVSGFEYTLAKKIGYQGANIVFNGPMKREEDLIQAMMDKSLVNVDNREELAHIMRLAEEMRLSVHVGIRLNSTNPMLQIGKDEWTRFGFNIENGEAEHACAAIMKHPFVGLGGFHIHVATNIANPQIYEQAAETVSSFALSMKEKYGLNIAYIDVGGGFGVKALRPHYREPWNVPPISDFLHAVSRPIKKNLSLLPQLIIEPGRFLVAESMTLATRVIAARYGGPGPAHVVVDASTSMISTAINHSHPIRPLAYKRHHENTLLTTIFGSSCTPIDILGKVNLPLLQENDILLIEYCGAYSLSRSSQFISPRPAVLNMHPDGTGALVRRRENPSDLTNLDVFR